MSKENRDYVLYLEDILDALEKIENYTKDISFVEFSNNDMVVDAVIRNFEVIGEATKNVPEEIKEKYPEVEWREATGFRNVLIHDYFGIDIEAVYYIFLSLTQYCFSLITVFAPRIFFN